MCDGGYGARGWNLPLLDSTKVACPPEGQVETEAGGWEGARMRKMVSIKGVAVVEFDAILSD